MATMAAQPPSSTTLKFLVCFLSLLTPAHPSGKPMVNPLDHRSLNNPLGQLVSSDLQALQEFKTSVELSQSNPLNQWKPEIHACRWDGITCYKNRVTRIILNGFNLSGSFEALARLQKVDVISLKRNRFTTIPHHLSGLKFLTALSLSRNNITGHLPDWLGSNLEDLDISFNSLTGNLPVNSLNGLMKLRRLKLEGNMFDGELTGLNLPGLIEFNVSGNNFSGPIPLFLSQFPCSAFTGNKIFPLPNCSDVSSTLNPVTTTGAGIPMKRVLIFVIGFLLVALVSCLICHLYNADPDPIPIPMLYVKHE